MDQEKFWEMTADQHIAGQQLLRKLEWLQKAMDKQPQYIRAEIAEIVDLARKAIV